MNRILEICDLHKQFSIKGGKDVIRAVDGVNFHVKAGETLGLIGESGSGKTTVGRCVLRLIEPDTGVIIFDGNDITNLPFKQIRPLRKRMQMVFQDPYASLDPRFAISKSISEPLIFAAEKNIQQRKERVREVANMVGLDEAELNSYPHQLNAGDQQRVGIARALATKPSLIVLDEPVSSLDLTIRSKILNLLSKIQSETNVSYLYISHDLTTVEFLCNRVAVMYLGKLIEIGDKDEIFMKPIHPYSRALLSSALNVDPMKKNPKYFLNGEIPSAINVPSGCVLHNRCPEAIPECSNTVPFLKNGFESKPLSNNEKNEIKNNKGYLKKNYTYQEGEEHYVACIRIKHMLQKPFNLKFED